MSPTMNHYFKRWRSPAQRRRGVVGFLAMLLCASTASLAALQNTGTFKGSWTATGTAQTLDLGESRSASILRLRGTIVAESTGGLARALQSDCVGLRLQDGDMSGIGRCVWTDSDGDRVFSEVTGALAGEVSKVHGLFVGGTGKYTGLEGAYELKWRYFRGVEEEGTIHGYSASLTGSWKLP